MKDPRHRRAIQFFSVFAIAAIFQGGFLAAQADDPPESQNAPASSAETPGKQAPTRTQAQPTDQAKAPKSFTWTFDWEGWNGLHYGVQKTSTSGVKVESDRGVVWWDTTKLAFTGKFGARLALDGASFFNAQGISQPADQFEVRRARIYMAGDVVLLAPFSFRIELGASGGQFYTEESYILFKKAGFLGSVMAGQYQAPMSLEASGSSRDLTFMEPGSPVSALAPGVNAGIQASRAVLSNRLTWTLGLFTNGSGRDNGDASKNASRAIGRVTWLPVDSDAGGERELVHLGLSLSHMYSGSDAVRYQSRPESHLAPYSVDTDYLNASSADTLGIETAWVGGPFSVQSEYLQSDVHLDDGGQPSFRGWYVFGSWFLTGESRPYDARKGVFERLIPFRNFSATSPGKGALELAARVSYVDLTHGAIDGGEMRDLTLGLNWYLHPHAKVRVNYVHSKVDRFGELSKLNILEARLEVDF